MNKVISKDGTEIAYDQRGSGPAVILVDGALCYRSFGPMTRLSELLSPHFTVYAYDRRGRGDSGDCKPYAIEREVEDIETLIQAAGGTAFVFGTSSGAALSLEAATRLGSKITKLALYEAPYNADPVARQQWKEYRKALAEVLVDGQRGDAIALFMQLVGTPAEQVEGMRQSPMWPMLESVAPTLAYDAAALGDGRSAPLDRAARIQAPTLVMDGGANLTFMPFMHETAMALTHAIPNAQQRTLEDQTHDVNLDVLAPVLIEFFAQ